MCVLVYERGKERRGKKRREMKEGRKKKGEEKVTVGGREEIREGENKITV